MELIELQEILAGSTDELVKKITDTRVSTDIPAYQNQYDPKKHSITDTSVRPDKTVDTETGTRIVVPARLPIPLQKKIVALAAAFLCGNPIQLDCTPADQAETDFLAVLRRAWDDCKLDYKSKALAKLMMSETEVAEVWYAENAEEGHWKGTALDGKTKFKLRMKVLANKYGDKLYPLFDNQGEMIAFGRAFVITVAAKEKEHFELYTQEKTYLLVKEETGWTVTDKPNAFKKIPVIYYSQGTPEWHDVQELIDRLETLISNHADTNDYFGSPMITVSGEITGFAMKGETGKVLELKGGATAGYLTWDQSPESVKLEYNNLRSLIFDMTDTPDISIEQMKALGTYSGIALKMLFLGAHLKAADKEEIFGEGVQRRINLMKRILTTFSTTLEAVEPLNVKPKFEYYLPKNVEEMVNILTTATGAKPLISQESAVSLNPLVKDAVTEFEKVKGEGLNDENL